MKYEAVFGDQSLFDNAPLGTELVGHSGGFYKNSPDGPIYCGGCTFTTDEYRNIGFIAARRIIRTPTWMVEDQKAGRLPEVGCRVNFCYKLNTNWRTGEIKYIDDQVAVIKADAVDRPFVYEVDRVEFKPIETTEEKARRERAEWAKKASQFIDDELDCVNLVGEHVMRRFYNAMLSGELPMPGKE